MPPETGATEGFLAVPGGSCQDMGAAEGSLAGSLPTTEARGEGQWQLPQGNTGSVCKRWRAFGGCSGDKLRTNAVLPWWEFPPPHYCCLKKTRKKHLLSTATNVLWLGVSFQVCLLVQRIDFISATFGGLFVFCSRLSPDLVFIGF